MNNVALSLIVIALVLSSTKVSLAEASTSTAPVVAEVPPIADGPFKPTMESLAHYRTPEWFQDANDSQTSTGPGSEMICRQGISRNGFNPPHPDCSYV